MATRSTIGVELPNGKVKSVYCHWDGYPSGVGVDLLSLNFDNPTEVEEWIDEGDRSTVGLSYKEWRGEDSTPTTYESIDEYFESDLEDWGYLFTQEGEWLVKDMNDKLGPIKLESYF